MQIQKYLKENKRNLKIKIRKLIISPILEKLIVFKKIIKIYSFFMKQNLFSKKT
ncbi:MAG: hypothetical protein ACD_4C00219G0001, partial [uncultured bacterium (gcode 4)]